MGRILRDIYNSPEIAPLVGLKGGTCAYFFYGLPRFSVDLDFDVLRPETKAKEEVFAEIRNILKQYGRLKDEHIKQNTILFHLSYGDKDHNIKVELNTRPLAALPRLLFEDKKYLGISMLAAKKDYLFAGKLLALTGRGETAMRDIYDIWYFAENNWEINRDVIENMTGKHIKDHLADCIAKAEKIKDSQILKGLGELVPAQDKEWVRNNLKKEVLFHLRNYREVYNR